MTEYSKLHWQIHRRIADGKIAMACDVQDITQRDITRMKQHTRMRKQLSGWTPGDVVADGTLVLTKHIFRGIPTAAQMLAEIKATKNFGAAMKEVVELTRSRKTPAPPVFGDTIARQKKLADEVLKTERPVLAALEDQPTEAVYLPRDLADKLRAFCELRGTTIADIVRVSMTQMLRANKYYDIDTPLGFGKYAGERIETIVRLDPGYVRWALDNIEGLVVSDGVIELLDSMLKLQQNGASAPEK